MPRSTPHWPLAALLMLVASTACAQAPTLPATQAGIAPDSTIRRIVERRLAGRPGAIVVGVSEGGRHRFVWSGSPGPGTRPPLDEHALFEIGSITKTFTAALLAEMVERGEVRLDEPVARLLGTGAVVPSAGGREITLEHLATHTSGLPRLPNNMAPRDIRDPYASYSVAELEAFLRGYTLPRAPGERVEYSNLGYGLMGHALSVRAGRSLAELYAARLTAPLAMRETWSVVPPAAAARFVAGHAGRDTAAHWTFDVIAGAGVLRSSAADMLRYLDALLAPDAATPLARALRTVQGQRVPVNPMVAVGLGWHRLSRPAGPLVWHNGGTGGFRSMAVLDSTRRRAVIVLASTDASMDDIGIHLLDPSFPLTEPPPLPEPLLKRAPKEPDAR